MTNLVVSERAKFAKAELKIELDKITIPTLTKLFVIRIVANNSLGLPKSFKTDLAFLSLSPFSSSLSPGLKEKKAASDPDIRAEEASNDKSINIDMISQVLPNPALIALSKGAKLSGSI